MENGAMYFLIGCRFSIQTAIRFGGVGTGFAPILTSRTKKKTSIPQARQNKKVTVSMVSSTSLLNNLRSTNHATKKEPRFLLDPRRWDKKERKFRQVTEKICATGNAVFAVINGSAFTFCSSDKVTGR
jgi:hypothetical protein